jgi:hypothetical protein
VCVHCKRVFNILSAPPSVPPECVPGRTEHEVEQRPDDTEETVRERLRVYEEKTRKPVSGFYSYTGLIRTVHAEGDIDEVTKRLLDTLRAGSGAAEPDEPVAAKASAKKPAKKSTKKAKVVATRKPAPTSSVKAKAKAKPKAKAKAKMKAKPGVKAKAKSKSKATKTKARAPKRKATRKK